MTTVPFTEGVHRVRDGCRAWLAPDGTWGLSNSGLVTGDGESLLVDTLFDLRHTTRMLEAMRPVTDTAPITTVVTTHANGDHYFGNQLLADREIVASTAAAAAMTTTSLDAFRARLEDPGRVGSYVRDLYRGFDFDGIEITPPTRTVEDRLRLDVGGTPVELIVVGPAHTAGDLVVHLPDAGLVYAGDILFVGGTPIVWAGPISNWRRACELLLSLDADVFVPGHGPVTDAAGIRRMVSYLDHVESEARACFRAGLDLDEAIATLDLGEFAHWHESSRVVQNIAAVYRELDPSFHPPTTTEVFDRMAVYTEAHS